MKVVFYGRVSTDRQELGVEAQREACRRFATLKGWKWGQEFIDDGVSGGAALNKRPSLLGALESIGKGSVLLVAKRDRLAREVFLSAWIAKEVKKRGSRIVSAAGEGTESSDPASVLLQQIVDAFSEYERAIIKCRTKAAMSVLKMNGRRHSRFAPFGFRYVEGGGMVEEPGEQAVIGEILDLRREGLSLARICAELHRRDRQARGGGKWHPKVVRSILKAVEKAERTDGFPVGPSV